MTEHEYHDEIADRLAQLPVEADPVNDLWPGIEPRVREPRSWRGAHTFVQLAAASVIFAVGLGTGLAFGFTRTTPAAPQSMRAMNLAVEVQRTGTQYVTALAAFAAVVDSLSEDVRIQGREAAITALLAAAQEWGTLRGTPPGENDLFKTVSNERDQVATVRF
jgi:hypothetical protein